MLNENIKSENTKEHNGPSEIELMSLAKHYELGFWTEAERIALHMSQEFPMHSFSWKVLGAIFKESGRLDDALGAYQKSLTLAPFDIELHSNLGILFHGMGRFDEAVTYFKHGLSLNPGYVGLHINLGITLAAVGNLEEAGNCFKKAIDLDEENAEAHFNLAIIFMKMDS